MASQIFNEILNAAERPAGQVQRVKISLPSPHSNLQSIIMKALTADYYIDDIFIACGSKFGKTISASVAQTLAVMNASQGDVFRWIAPIYRQTMIGQSYFSKMLPSKPYSDFNKGDMTYRVQNGASIQFWHTQRPVDLEGEGVRAQVGDEAAKMLFQAYISAKTTTTMTRGPSMWISTPFGKNWFYKKFKEAEAEMKWAIKKGVNPEKIAIHAATTANPFISPEVIENAKKNLPDRLFRQHYLAEFVDGGTVFTNLLAAIEGDEIEFDNELIQLYLDRDRVQEAQVVIGADWGKSDDYTVFTALDIVSRRLVGFMRFYKTQYHVAVGNLVRFARHFGSVIMIRHDKTGVGNAIDDLMSLTNLPYEGLVFTNSNKSQMVNDLIVAYRS